VLRKKILEINKKIKNKWEKRKKKNIFKLGKR